jgi:ABC-2 type transport system ATP-binding protein
LTREEGMTVLMSSHLLHHVEKYSDRVAIMTKGGIVRMGSVSPLTKGENVIELELAEVDEGLISKIRELRDVKSVERRGNKIVIVASEDIREEVLEVMSGNTKKILGMKFMPSLERVYARYVEEGV